MSKLVWDKTGERFYETGVDHGVLFVSAGSSYGNGVPWNGLTAVNQSPSGAESSKQWADNIAYLNLISAEEFGATIEAFYSPAEFDACDGTVEIAPGVTIGQQARKTFGFAYRTRLGNDQAGTDYGYKLHLIYNANASPSERSYNTINDSPEAATLSWEVTTTAIDVPGFKPTSHITIDSTRVIAGNLKKLEDILFGTETSDSRLPLPAEVYEIMSRPEAIKITVGGPDADTEVMGKMVSALQTGITIRAKDIIGSLNYVTNYTGFSNDPGKQSGNFLALEVTTDPSSTVTYELVGGTDGVKTLDEEDGILVVRVTNKDAQVVRITATTGTETVVKNYALNELTLLNGVG